MADLITVRILVFLAAFFALQRLMPVVIPRPTRFHGLGIIGIASFVAFVSGALILEEPMGNTIYAWVVIYFFIALFMFLRWRSIDAGEAWRRRQEEARGRDPNERYEPPEP